MYKLPPYETTTYLLGWVMDGGIHHTVVYKPFHMAKAIQELFKLPYKKQLNIYIEGYLFVRYERLPDNTTFTHHYTAHHLWDELYPKLLC